MNITVTKDKGSGIFEETLYTVRKDYLTLAWFYDQDFANEYADYLREKRENHEV